MLLPSRTLPAGFIAPCLPTSAPQPPSGEAWLHEIKHDGFRVMARKDGIRVKLYSRPGNDLTKRFPHIVDALSRLRSRSCIIDGEAVSRGEDGIASFDRIRYRHDDDGVFLYAFDLIELDGDDLRRNLFKFKDVSTTVRPDRAATTLVISGPYKITRNPMYFGLALVYLGITIAGQSVWALILLPVVLAIIQRRAIEPEEPFLEKRFGSNYIGYKEKVRRWL
jgi:hypothetical protein